MKTNVKIIMATIVVAMMAFSGCRKTAPQETGKMTVKMTDAPGDYKEVNVEIDAVMVYYPADSMNPSRGWVTLNTRAGVYNLLKYQNNASVDLAHNEMPQGRITKVRFMLGKRNTLVKQSGGTFDLAVFSNTETATTMNVNEEIRPNSHLVILVDFDAEKSIMVEGLGAFSLKPHLEVKSISRF